MERILIVEDEKGVRDVLGHLLKREGYEVTVAASGEDAVRVLDEEIFDLVITDIKLPKLDGIGVLKAVKETQPDTAVIMITAYAKFESAVSAMQEGAYDYIAKPFNVDEISLRIRRALERRRLLREYLRRRREQERTAAFDRIIGASEKMERVLETVRKIADSPSTVLILGESGTGKELIARAIHFNSGRRERPFVTVNCSALPETLLESELFGHMKGAFTGAVVNKSGLFEVADTGTLFLDEIGEIPPSTQVKLLRVLQDKQFRRIGGTKDLQVDVRVIAASNRDLERAIREGTFREDLYYRLSVIPIRLPTLRERREDIPLLVTHFVHEINRALGRQVRSVTPQAMALLTAQPWRGNVRELENVIARVMALTSGEQITLTDLTDCLGLLPAPGVPLEAPLPGEGLDLDEMIQRIEKDLLVRALERTHGTSGEAARLLRLNPRSLRYRLSKYGIKPGA